MKRLFLIFVGLLCVAVCGVLITSCNVTRTVTTSSQYVQRGDTTVVIQSKTIESYDAEHQG